jgi:tetratricopeptide (TPR) repeat protein
MAATLNNLAGISFKRGNYEEALEQYLKVLDVDIHTLSADDPELANTYHNVAIVQIELKNYLQALENATKAFYIAKKSNHPHMYEHQRTIDNIQKKITDN